MKRADFQADTGAGFWGKAESMNTSRRAHLWRQTFGVMFKSPCGLRSFLVPVASDHHTQRCKRCEASK